MPHGCIKTEGGKSAYFVDGVRVTKAAFYRTFRPRKTVASAFAKAALLRGRTYPMVTEALGVHPEQVAEANARNKAHGVNVTYDEDGRGHIPDAAERKKLLRLEKVHGNNSYYGD